MVNSLNDSKYQMPFSTIGKLNTAVGRMYSTYLEPESLCTHEFIYDIPTLCKRCPGVMVDLFEAITSSQLAVPGGTDSLQKQHTLGAIIASTNSI